MIPMKNINIPEPCSENWNEMTPTQKGAFCQKCALDVFDFTNKSAIEIRTILAENIGSRVCGHIKNVQLVELNSNFEAWKINSGRSYQRAWVFTLFVVFGLTLFSCEEENIAEKMQRVGQQILNDQLEEFQEPITTKGEMVSSDHVSEVHTENSISREKMEHLILGKMQIQEVVESVEIKLTEHELPEMEIYSVDGGMTYSLEFERYLIETNPSLTEIDSQEKYTKMSGLIYPNPAENETTLRLQMPKGDRVEIQLIGINGQRIQEIHSGRVGKGETEFTVDVSQLIPGMYVVVIVSGDQKETVKFTKI
jgi:hypothetical protein